MTIKLTLAAASAALVTAVVSLPAQAFSIGSSYTIAGQAKFSSDLIDFINTPVLESATGDFSSLNGLTLGPTVSLRINPRVFDISKGGSGLLVDFDNVNIDLTGFGLGTISSSNTFDFVASSVTFLPGSRYRFTGTFGDGTKAIGELAQLVEVGNSGVFGYAATFTAVPTPALLPGLIGMGIAAVRRKKNEAADETA
ncbi:hypothetical protein C8255_00915 [filamentous cyanobacterium CCP3]|nr:hypothetical protein C8255_00915 [filamentous cyanobacterium CCP3]